MNRCGSFITEIFFDVQVLDVKSNKLLQAICMSNILLHMSQFIKLLDIIESHYLVWSGQVNSVTVYDHFKLTYFTGIVIWIPVEYMHAKVHNNRWHFTFCICQITQGKCQPKTADTMRLWVLSFISVPTFSSSQT